MHVSTLSRRYSWSRRHVPRESPGLAAQGRRRFREEQNSAAKVNTNGLTCPPGALDQVVTTGRTRRSPEALFSL
jgi:hypothetical protein